MERTNQLFKNIVLKPEKFDEAIRLCLELHAMVYSSEMSLIKTVTFEDELWEGLDKKTFRKLGNPLAQVKIQKYSKQLLA